MHLGKHITYFVPQCSVKFNFHPAPCFAIKQCSSRNITRKHLFKAHCLTAKLQCITGSLVVHSALVFNGIGLPKTITILQLYPVRRTAKFQYITLSRNPEGG